MHENEIQNLSKVFSFRLLLVVLEHLMIRTEVPGTRRPCVSVSSSTNFRAKGVEHSPSYSLQFQAIDHLDYDTIRPLAVDYDLWWRTQRMILSNSTIGCFRTLRKKTLLIQGPWYLYKVLSEAFWIAFGPIFVYRVFLRTSSKNSPVASKTPELKQITETMIALWSWRRDHLLFEGHCHLARLIKLALYELVSLVRNSNKIVHVSTHLYDSDSVSGT